MEQENYLRMLLTNSPPVLLGKTSSQASPIASVVPTGPPPQSTPTPQERHWSNAAVRFLLSQCKEHVEVHNTITMRHHQWVRIHKLLIAQFPHESGRKVKSLSDKWEKLRSTYSRIKKLRYQTGGGARDDGAKFIWYDQIDEILSLTAKANGVSGGMDQGFPVPRTGNSSAPVDLTEELNDEGPSSPLQSPPCSVPDSSVGTGQTSTGSSPRTRAANLVGCRGKGTTPRPTKRTRIERNLMDALDRMAESTAEIEKMRIEASLTMHKENLVEREENRKLERDLFEMQQANAERMATLFADVVKKNAQ